MPERVTWGPGREQAFTDYLTEAMHRAIGERSSLEQKWRKWLQQYRGPMATSIKRFPYENAADFTMQFTAMTADPLIARYMTTLHAPANLWTLQALNERWVPIAKPMQDYLQYLDQTRLKMFDVNYRAMLEFVKLGTCIYKHGWAFERRRKNAYDALGRVVAGTELVSGPFVDHVSLPDFLIPADSYNVQPDMQGGAPWIAERFYLNRPAFMARASGQEPFLPDYEPRAVEVVKNFEDSTRSGGGVVQDEKYRLDDYAPTDLRRIELWEAHCRFDTTGQGTVDDVVVVIHLPSRVMLRAIYQPYAHNARPYSVARYMRGEGFYGIGVCEQAEMPQTVLSELLNANIDNVRLANAPMLGVKPGANVVPGEPIYLLKMWMLENPQTDIREVKFTTPYPSLQQLGTLIQAWGERRVGLNDLQRGNPEGLPSRTPATSMLSLLQEGNRRLDLSLKDLRFCLDEVGRRTLQNCQQFMSNPVQNPNAEMELQMVVQAMGEPEGNYVARTLALPLDDIGSGVGVSVTATSGSVNKEVEKQSFLALVQLQAQLGGQYLQLAQILGNPQLQLMAPVLVQTAAQIFKGFSELQRRLLEQFDIRNPEEILVNAAVLLDAAAQPNPLALLAGLSAGAVGGGSGGASQTAGAAGMGGVQPSPGVAL